MCGVEVEMEVMFGVSVDVLVDVLCYFDLLIMGLCVYGL